MFLIQCSTLELSYYDYLVSNCCRNKLRPWDNSIFGPTGACVWQDSVAPMTNLSSFFKLYTNSLRAVKLISTFFAKHNRRIFTQKKYLLLRIYIFWVAGKQWNKHLNYIIINTKTKTNCMKNKVIILNFCFK